METKIKISIFNNNSQLNNSNSEDIIQAKESGIHNQHLNNHVIEENIIIMTQHKIFLIKLQRILMNIKHTKKKIWEMNI